MRDSTENVQRRWVKAREMQRRKTAERVAMQRRIHEAQLHRMIARVNSNRGVLPL